MNLVLETDPILKTNVLNNKINWDELHNNQIPIQQIMIQNQGMGLAANQVGIAEPFFITNGVVMPQVVCYPKILSQSDVTQRYREGCLSFPGLTLNVSRSVEVQVEFYDLKQKYHSMILKDLAARLFLHEYDHLNGICFVDRVAKLSLKMALEKRRKRNE